MYQDSNIDVTKIIKNMEDIYKKTDEKNSIIKNYNKLKVKTKNYRACRNLLLCGATIFTIGTTCKINKEDKIYDNKVVAQANATDSLNNVFVMDTIAVSTLALLRIANNSDMHEYHDAKVKYKKLNK